MWVSVQWETKPQTKSGWVYHLEEICPDELDPVLARLFQSEDEEPDLITITFESLHECLGNQGPHSVHEDGDQHSAIQQEESAEQFQPTKQE